MGSEGAFGVITEVTLKVRPVPEVKVYEGWRFDSFAAGADAMRRLAQGRAMPTVLRLSDEAETSVNLARPDAVGGESSGGCLMIAGYEGTPDQVARARGRDHRAARRGRRRRRSARSRARRGRRGASTAPTCATRCSTSACSWRPSRP